MITGFAWAIGGEHYFGRWRRGVLVAIPALILGALMHFHWSYYIGVCVLAYVAYQLLFYDNCIQSIYQSIANPILGILGLLVNGMLAGSISALFQWYKSGSVVKVALVLVLSALAFTIMCMLANELDTETFVCKRVGQVKVWCPADTWWLGCFVFGCVLDLCYLV